MSYFAACEEAAMSYATLMVNVDRVSERLVRIAADLADKFSARLIGLSALAIMPPFVAEGVVIVDNATEFDIAQIKSDLLPQVSLQDIFA